jgi:hypothetical protein
MFHHFSPSSATGWHTPWLGWAGLGWEMAQMGFVVSAPKNTWPEAENKISTTTAE